MSDLYPTKTRLALLRDVARGAVLATQGGSSAWVSGGTKVTARIDEMVRAGWVRLSAPSAKPYRAYELTDAGRAVLDTHGGQPS